MSVTIRSLSAGLILTSLVLGAQAGGGGASLAMSRHGHIEQKPVMAVRAPAPGPGVSVIVHGVKIFPDPVSTGWTDVIFKLVVENTQIGLLSLTGGTAQLNLRSFSASLVAKWQTNAYQGKLVVPTGVLPDGFRAAAEAIVTVPTAALNATAFALTYNGALVNGSTNTQGSLTLRLHGPFAPLPALPAAAPRALTMGQTFREPQIAVVTPVTQTVGLFASASNGSESGLGGSLGVMSASGDIFAALDNAIAYTAGSGSGQDVSVTAVNSFAQLSTNWLLGIRWQNLTGQDASLPVTFQLMVGDQIIPLSPAANTLAPLYSGVAVLPVPVLFSNQPYYLVITGNDALKYAVFRIKPPAHAETWIAPPWLNGSFSSITFPNSHDGWVVGGTGYSSTIILHTNNGGATWKTQTSGIHGGLLSVAFPDARDGWAVGGGGTILHTNNGGATWKTQTSGTAYPLDSVAFPNAQDGWATGLFPAILHTNNGGATWKVQTNGIQSTLDSVTFRDAHDGWAVGQGSGVILHTNNGGATWQTQTSGISSGLFSVAFPDARDGWAVGFGGTILHTSNGGATWKTQTSGTQSPLLSVVFSDAHDGWAVGYGGTILHTNDGGATWRVLAISSDVYPFRAVAPSDAHNIWVIGGSQQSLLHFVLASAH